MDDVLIGIVIALIGAAVCFLGLRLWFVMLPIWGFVAGFFIGAMAITSVFGDGFLSTVTGWVAGFVVGLLFAAFSYVYWYVGVLLAAGSVGALVGSGAMQLIGFDSDWLLFIVSAMAAVVFVFVALLLALPVYVVVINTALVGATGLVTGVLLVFNRIDREDLSYGATVALLDAAWFWAIALLVVAVLGMAFQQTTIQNLALPSERWGRAAPSYAS